MKLKELEITTGQVYLNVKRGNLVDTMMLAKEEAVERYGELEVLHESHPEGQDVTDVMVESA